MKIQKVIAIEGSGNIGNCGRTRTGVGNMRIDKYVSYWRK